MGTAPLWVAVLTLLLAPNQVERSPEPAADAEPSPLRLGVLHVNTRTGRRFYQGIRAAFDAQAKATGPGALTSRIELQDPVVYGNEKAGVDALVGMITDDKADIVLGPTESGVFVRALEQRETLETYRVPVISSQVTADVSFQENSYFFLTNVDVTRRAEAIADYLHRYWLTSIAVLYADNEFGTRAETAFRRAFIDRRNESILPLAYQPLYYTTEPLRVRDQILQIVDRHPEAVGIFGEREHIKDIYRRFRELNYGTAAYRPLFFTVLDARAVETPLNDFYFVSVAGLQPRDESGPAGILQDDVWSLSYDTTKIVLDLVQAIPLHGGRADRRKALRNLLETKLRENAVITGTKTGMKFDHYQNDAVLHVLRVGDQGIEIERLDATIGLLSRIAHKLTLLHRRYGAWPWINAVLLVLVVAAVSVKDVRRRYKGKLRPMVFNRYFIILGGMNVLAAILLFIVLAETGTIRYDSVIATLLVAFTPTAVVRTFVFETRAGKKLGLGAQYEDVVNWVYDGLNVKQYLANQTFVNLIAYHNSQDGMTSALVEMAESEGKQEQMRAIIKDKLRGVESWMQRRRILARMLYEKVEWEDLEQLNLAPKRLVTKDDILEGRRPVRDPETVVREAAAHCAEEVKRSQKVNTLTDELLKPYEKRDEAWAKALEKAREKDLEGVHGLQGVLRKKIRFLLLLRGYSEDYLRSKDLLPTPDDDEPADQPDGENVGTST